jgi:thioredoxin 1
LEITDLTFEHEVLKCNMPVMVDFWASWCPPCKMMEPIVKNLAAEYEGKVRILYMNIDRNPGTATTYNILGVPTFMMFKNGKILWRLTAAQTEQKLRKLLDQVLEEKNGEI